MGNQAVRHLPGGAEQAGEDLAEGDGQRILRVHQVKVNRAVISIHYRLDRVADIVDVSIRGGVGEVASGGIGILDPEKPPVVDDQVGVAIVKKEGRQLAHPGAHIAVEHDPAFTGQLVRNQDTVFTEFEGEKKAPQEAAQGDASLPVVGGVDVLVPGGGIVKLGGSGLHDHIVAGQLAVIDGGLCKLQARAGHRGNIPHEVAGQTLG